VSSGSGAYVNPSFSTVWATLSSVGGEPVYYGSFYTNAECTQSLSGGTYNPVWAKVVVPINFSEGFEVNTISFHYTFFSTNESSSQVFSCDITPPIHTTGVLTVSSVSGGSIPDGT